MSDENYLLRDEAGSESLSLKLEREAAMISYPFYATSKEARIKRLEDMALDAAHLESRKVELETDVAFITRQRDKFQALFQVYAKHVNQLDDRIEYRQDSFSRNELHTWMRELTSELAKVSK